MTLSPSFRKMLYTLRENIDDVLEGPKPKLTVPMIRKAITATKKLRGVKSTGPNKTQLMLNALKDGKVHGATQLALAAGTTSGHVPTHLAGRIKKGLVKHVGPGLYQFTKKAKKAA